VETNRIAAWSALVVFLALIGYLGRIEGGAPPKDALYDYGTAIGSAILYGILLLVLLWIGRGLPKRAFFALRRPRFGWWSLGLAFGAYLLISAGAYVLITALDAADEQGLAPEAWDSSRAGAYAANFVTVALVGPVVEELMYRGAGMTLLSRFGVPLAVAATALGFGLGHGLLLALPALVFFGVVTALLRLKTESVYPCILVHAAFNATSLILVVVA
jgi:membrane protease YdiL (CAAX protease family)